MSSQDGTDEKDGAGGDSPDPPASDDGERRRQDRIAAAVVTELVVEERPHMAMLHDFSETGALVLTRTRVAAGEKVELRIHLGEGLEETLVTTGSVVRVEPWASGQSFWPLAVAVKFEVPARGHEQRLRTIAARQVELGIAPPKG